MLSDIARAIGSGASALTGILFADLIARMHDEADRLLGTVERRATRLMRRLVRMVAVAVLLALGAAFLLAALFFSLREAAGLSRWLSFLILALVTLALGITLSYAAARSQLREARHGAHERD